MSVKIKSAELLVPRFLLLKTEYQTNFYMQLKILIRFEG